MVLTPAPGHTAKARSLDMAANRARGRGMAVNELIMRSWSPKTGYEANLDAPHPSLTEHGLSASACRPDWTATAGRGLMGDVVIAVRPKAAAAGRAQSEETTYLKAFPQTEGLPPAARDSVRLTLTSSFQGSAALVGTLPNTPIGRLLLGNSGLPKPIRRARPRTSHGCS